MANLLKRALEAFDETNTGNIEDKTILLKGPLSDIYTQALNEVYANKNDEGAPTTEPKTNDSEVALESKDKKSKKKKDFKIEKGAFHKWLGKKPDQPITDADIEKGLKSKDPHVKHMAQFAKNAKKWHDKSKKVAKESFDLPALESKCRDFTTALESQQMDQQIMAKMAQAITDKDAPPTDSFQTCYGVSRNEVSENDVVEVASDLANKKDNEEYVLVMDICLAGDNGSSGGGGERVEVLGEALESIVLAYGGKVFHSLESAAKYILK